MEDAHRLYASKLLVPGHWQHVLTSNTRAAMCQSSVYPRPLSEVRMLCLTGPTEALYVLVNNCGCNVGPCHSVVPIVASEALNRTLFA